VKDFPFEDTQSYLIIFVVLQASAAYVNNSVLYIRIFVFLESSCDLS